MHAGPGGSRDGLGSALGSAESRNQVERMSHGLERSCELQDGGQHRRPGLRQARTTGNAITGLRLTASYPRLTHRGTLMLLEDVDKDFVLYEELAKPS